MDQGGDRPEQVESLLGRSRVVPDRDRDDVARRSGMDAHDVPDEFGVDPVIMFAVDPGDRDIDPAHVLPGLVEGGDSVGDDVAGVVLHLDEVAQNRDDAEVDAQLVLFEQVQPAVDAAHQVAEFEGAHAGDPGADLSAIAFLAQREPGLQGGE